MNFIGHEIVVIGTAQENGTTYIYYMNPGSGKMENITEKKFINNFYNFISINGY